MKNGISGLLTGLLTASTLLMGSAAIADDCSQGVYCGDDTCITMHAEALLGELCQTNPFATTNDGAGTTTDLFFGHNWAVGFRVGAGLNVPCHEWNMQADWTYFSNEMKASAEAPAGGTMQANLAEGNALSTEVSDDTDYHLVNLTLNYPVHICEGLSFRPYGGFRGLIIDREYKETNSGTDFNAGGELSTVKQDYLAYGLTGGLEWNFASSCDISFFGRFGGSVVRGKEDFTRSRLITAALTQHVSDEPCHITSSTDVLFGLGWQTTCCDTEFGLFASYELTHWMNIASPLNIGTNELDLNGLTVGAHLGF